MSTVQCPYCGEVMNAPLKFCTSCGRGVSQADMKKVGLRVKRIGDKKPVVDDDNGGQSFGRSRGDFRFHRQMRNFFLTSSLVIVLILVYYVVMKYVIHEKIPGNVDGMVEKFIQKNVTSRQGH